MKYYKNTTTNAVFAFEDDGSQDSFIKKSMVQMTDAEADAYMNPAKTIDQAIKEMENARDNAMFQPLLSNALGAPYTYSVTERNNNFLNNVITLGEGSKFTCVDENGVKARVFHTHAELFHLARDIEDHISAQFDKFEEKIMELEAATNQNEIDQVAW